MVATSNNLTPEDVQDAVIQYAGIKEALDALYDEQDRTFAIIYSYMTLQKATRLVVGKHTVTIPTSRSYDISKFQARLGEQFPDCIIPEHEQTKLIPAKVDGRKAKPLWDMGEDVTSELEQCLLPPKPQIKISSKGETHAR